MRARRSVELKRRLFFRFMNSDTTYRTVGYPEEIGNARTSCWCHGRRRPLRGSTFGRSRPLRAALTRNETKAAAIRSAGAEPVLADALAPAEVRSALAAARPDVIVHEMTSLRDAGDIRRFDRNFELTNRLRTEGLDNLLEAARQCGTSRIVAQSFCGWPYARSGGHVKTEEDPLDPDPPRERRRTLEAIRYLESRVLNSNNMTGLALRYGAFYGLQTGILEPNVIKQVRQRRLPQIGSAAGWWSFAQRALTTAGRNP
jgi:nucleoside-diphosphate-sugar epimerase